MDISIYSENLFDDSLVQYTPGQTTLNVVVNSCIYFLQPKYPNQTCPEMKSRKEGSSTLTNFVPFAEFRRFVRHVGVILFVMRVSLLVVRDVDGRREMSNLIR